jgi:hypothetical protein
MTKVSAATKTGLLLGAATAAAYLALAFWLQKTYVDPRPKGVFAARVLPPYVSEGGAAFSVVIAPPHVLPIEIQASPEELLPFADNPNVENDTRSSVVIYEGAKPLGPAHSNFADISKLGNGRFAFWGRQGLVFSASDNSDPNTNGRAYWFVVPER